MAGGLLAIFILCVAAVALLLPPGEALTFTPQQFIRDYIGWINDQTGAELHNVTIRDLGKENGGLGLFTKEPLKEGDVFISFPSRLAINADYVGRVADLAELDVRLSLSETNRLAVILIYEKFVDPKSRWKPYLNSLPTSFTTPLYFTEAELEELKETNAITLAQRRLREFKIKFNEMQRKIDDLAPHVFPQGVFTEENYMWALSIVLSRTITIDIKGNKYNCIVPLVDILNTGFPDEINSACRTSPEGNVECVATTGIPRGAEVLKTYSSEGLSNTELFLDYGIAFEGNDNDTLQLELPTLYPSFQQEKEKLLEELNPTVGQELAKDTHKQTHILLDWKKPLSELKGFLTFLRLIHLELTDLTGENRKKTIDKLNKREVISRKNEKLAVDSLIAHLRGKLTKYPTTLEEDETILNGLFEDKTNTLINKRNSVIIRLGEKKLLQQHISNLEAYLKKSSKPKGKQEPNEYKTNPGWSRTEF